MSAPIERSIELPQLTLRAQVWGADDAPPLLALHGWLDNAGSYARLAPLLANRWRVIALELPGHGHSDHLPPGTHYHFVDYVRAALAAADALGLQRFDLLGHSLGAGIAAMLAAAAPERIAKLLLIEGLGPLGDDGSHTLQRFRDGIAAPVNNKGLRVFRDVEQAIAARAIAGGLRAELARPIVERGLLEVADGWCWRSDPRLTRTSPLRIAESQIHALLRGIRAPTALLLARPATSYLPSHPMELRAACVDDIAVSHLDGGHHLHLEHPQAVADWATAHLGHP
ncbi:Pimeloyl-ACP methyl ester carboxylesterase [Dyella sp. OK004]|uniref:alpha/beta fold hydrolase n=1 Tax=Dyella sp. OK004 TaxID=1855292 RepID=UPI0008DF99FE|nr:alpha/beta hydrolase [Dyella sp. OK004]SFS17349.1 Pimeloyl-ACP methyl ester carboxylesterase [Dyella sp. OK004]